MADREREREDPLAERLVERDQDTPRGSSSSESIRAHPQSPRCPECGCADLTLIQEAEIVALYKCSKCGHLTAPVKKV